MPDSLIKKQVPGYVGMNLKEEIEKEAKRKDWSTNKFVGKLIEKGWNVYTQEEKSRIS